MIAKLKRFSKTKWIALFLVIFLQFYIAQRSVFDLPLQLMLFGAMFSFKTLPILSLLVVALMDVSVILFCKRVKLSLIIVTCFWIFLSVVNHIVYAFKSSVFAVSDLVNTKTAFNVLVYYNLHMEYYWVALILCSVISFGLIYFVDFPIIQRKRIMVPFFGSMIGFIVFCYAIDYGQMLYSMNDMTMAFGYPFVVMSSCLENFRGLDKPKGYDKKYGKEIADKKLEVVGENTPDIIFIVNESFYDLSILPNVTVDNNPFEQLKSREDVVYSHTIASGIGTGTNVTEVESLCSCSSYVYPNITPFMKFSMNKIPSVISVLKNFDYMSLANHVGEKENYNRYLQYKNIGFDAVKWKEDCHDLLFFENRMGQLYTDASVYDNLKTWYQDGLVLNKPLFLYCLTIQNHGGYDLNPEELDSVHVEINGEEISDVNEYASCVDLSVDAYLDLIDSYKNSDRDVIVIMVGDHGPYFLKDYDDGSPESYLRLRETPCLFWSNNQEYVEDWKKVGSEKDMMSFIYVMPRLFETLGWHVNGMYGLLGDLYTEYPVVTSVGDVYDANGEKVEDTLDVSKYFSVEYEFLRRAN